MRDLDELFRALANSKFRQRFSLTACEAAYLAEKSLPTVLEHAADFLRERLAPAMPLHDGRQTPMKGHPVFVAQHATATCCRGCMAKWHHIPSGRELTSAELDYLLAVLKRWLAAQPPSPISKLNARPDAQSRLF